LNDTRGGCIPGDKENERTKTKKNQGECVVHPYSTDLAEFFKQPLKDAGNPGLARICEYYGFSRKQLLPDLT